jgi:hypothetical protein
VCAAAKALHGENGVEGAEDVLKAYHATQKNMATPPKSVLVEALKIVRKELVDTPEWSSLKPTEVDDWDETISRRIRNSIRAVSQAMHKRSRPKWLSKLPWALDTCAETQQELDEEDEFELEEVNDLFEYGVSDEFMLPYRRHKESGVRENGLPIVIDAYANPADEIVGTWPDNSFHGLSMTVAQFQLKLPAGPRAKTTLYEVEHHATFHKIAIRQRADRHLLISVYEQSKQILQVRADVFGEVPEEVATMDPKEPVVVAAVEFLKPIVKDYASGRLSAKQLSEERDKRLEAKGLGKSKILKRPSAKPPSTATPDGIAKPDPPVKAEPTEPKPIVKSEPKIANKKNAAQGPETNAKKKAKVASEPSTRPAATTQNTFIVHDSPPPTDMMTLAEETFGS